MKMAQDGGFGGGENTCLKKKERKVIASKTSVFTGLFSAGFPLCIAPEDGCCVVRCIQSLLATERENERERKKRGEQEGDHPPPACC